MPTDDWFDDVPTLAAMLRDDPKAAAEKLRELDLLERPAPPKPGEAVAKAGFLDLTGLFGRRAWRHTGHTFGFLAPAGAGADPLPIHDAGAIAADPALRGARVKVTLDALRAADYPGGGEHQVLFDFYARSQTAADDHHLHFALTARVREGESAAVVGHPIFVGLAVGPEGLSFKGFTVNVKNTADEAFLKFLDSDAFRSGLQVVAGAQPVLAPFSAMAVAVARAVAARSRNVPVQDFFLGLDFSTIPTRAKLAVGSYIALQVPEDGDPWRWADWEFDPPARRIVGRRGGPAAGQPAPAFNYLIFSVSRCEGD